MHFHGSLFLAGVLGAAVLSAADVVALASLQVESATVWAFFFVDLFAGLSAAAAIALFAAFSGGIQRLLRFRLPGLQGAWVEATLLALLSVPLGVALFSGRGISRSLWGGFGPWLVPPVVLAGAYLVCRLYRSVARRASDDFRPALVLFALLLGTSAAALYADRTLYLGLYGYLHVLLVIAALVSATGSFFVLFISKPPPFYVVGSIVGSALMMGLTAVIIFPSTNTQRLLLARNPLMASRVKTVVSWFRYGGGRSLAGSVELGRELLARRYTTSYAKAGEIVARARGRPTLLVVFDALRFDRLGDPRFEHLAWLQANSIGFARAYAASSSTATSLPAIAAAKHLPRVVDKTFAQRLSKHRTALVAIDMFVDLLQGLDPRSGYYGYPFTKGFDRVEVIKTGYTRNVTFYTGDLVTDRVANILDSADVPDLTWVHYFDLHQWYWIQADWMKGSPTQRYDTLVERLDGELGRLLSYRDRINLIVFADHGEGLGDHNVLFHTSYLHGELLHVPLMLYVPQVAPAQIDAPVSLVDLMPTVFELVGAELPPSWRGRSLLGLAGVADPGPGPPAVAFEIEHWSIAQGDYRLIYDPRLLTMELYDIGKDPAEKRNLADSQANLAARLLGQLVAIRAAVTPQTGEL